MRTALVILNWNTKDYLREFLPPMLRSCEEMDLCPDGTPQAGVIVADSASTDGSMDMMAAEFPEVRTIPLDSNYGFTGGYNRALQQIDAQYYILVNSDIEVPSGWLRPLVDWMDTHPECGICGPKLHALVKRDGSYDREDRFEYAGAAGGYVDRFGYPFCRGRVLKHTEYDSGQYDLPHDVLWVSGACLMVRSSLWKSLSGLDDRFFAHMEEIDLCWRANRSGWKVTVVPSSVVYHLGGGTLPASSPWKLELNFRNNLLLLDNNDPCRLIITVRMVLDGFSALVYLLTGRTAYFKAVLKAHRAYRSLRGLNKIRDAGSGALPGSAAAMRKICILPLAAIKRNSIFKYLKRYEDSH